MRKIIILTLIVILFGSLVTSGCAEQKQVTPPLLPPGFEQSKVPNVDLDGFLYLAQDTPFVIPGETIYPPVKQLSVCLSPTALTEALWLRGSFNSPSEAKSAYQSIADSEDIWKLHRERDLFVIYSRGFTAEPLVRATTQNDFVAFKETYPDVWELINRLPANPPSKAVGAGFVRPPSDNFKNWLQDTFGNGQVIVAFTEVVDKARIETIAIGLYSKADLNLIGRGRLEDSGLSILLVGKSSYPGFVISIISQVLPWIGMTGDYIDGEKVYVISFDNIHLVLKNVGNYIYLSAALGSADAKELLATALGTQVPLPPAPVPTSADSFDYPVKDDNLNDNLEWKVIQGFGELYAEMGGYHSGEDWNLVGGGPDADLGKPVYAVGNGEIKKVSSLGRLGYLVAIEHQAALGKTFIIPVKYGQSYFYPAEEVTKIVSVYVHLMVDESKIFKGAWIKKGFPIGTIMNPGGGPHLHFEIRHPDARHSSNWTMVGDKSNWAILDNKVTGYYLDLRKMVDAGLRDPSEFIKANSEF